MADKASDNHPWPRRVDSLSQRSSSIASSSRSDDVDDRRSLSKKWRHSWLSKIDRSSTPSRRTSTSTTSSSTVSASTLSSACTISSGQFDIYRLPETASDLSSDDGEGEKTFDTVDDATLALAALADCGIDDEEKVKKKERESVFRPRSGIPLMRRAESRASSSLTQRSTKPRDNPSESAEIEMVAREYQGYWRPSFTSKLPSAAAICGSMLLTARLPALNANESKIDQSEELKEQAYSLCASLETAEDPHEALDALRAHSLESIVVALRASLDGAQIPMVPEKTSWAMYQKVAQAKTRPEKLPDLWTSVAKLFKKVPSDTLVVIMFLLGIARRLQSRRVSIDGRSPAVYFLQHLWPRYLGDDVSKLLLLHYDEIPHDLPLLVESVNYRFSGRRCNLLALVASRRGKPEPGVREIRPSDDRQVEW